jgi:D-glycero-D-manno-heptose 1,7-bisphosphate phosphatase
MKRPAVFFDRDNTLIASDGYLGDPAKVALIPGAADAIARVRALGYAVVVFSNQSGVARGMFSEEDVQAVNARMAELLLAENGNAVIDRHEFCPFHPAGSVDVYARDSDRRKPKPGMIHAAAGKLALDLPRSWVIGDAARDIEAGKAAGCRAILFTDPSLPKSPAAEAPSRVPPDFTADTLAEAVDFVERNPDPDLSVAPELAATAAGEPAVAITPAPAVETPASEPTRPSQAQTTVEAPAEPSPTGKRVPKVAIGSRYVPPEGKSGAAPPAWMRTGNGSSSPADEAGERPARKSYRPADQDVPPMADLPVTPTERSEALLEQIFMELRRQHEQQDADFSVSKLFAGVVQVIALATLFLAYLNKKADVQVLHTYLLLAIMLQTLTIALLIMSRQK